MSGILVYALHYEGAFNKNSLGAVSEGARLAGELGTECHAIVVGDKAGLPDDLCASLGTYGASKVYRVEGPEGLAQPVVDAMAKLVAERPILQDSQISDVHYRSGVGVIIGRLNAFEAKESGSGSAAVEDVQVDFEPHSIRAKMVTRGEQRGADVNIEDADILVAGGS